jgi:hypothetical protein
LEIIPHRQFNVVQPLANVGKTIPYASWITSEQGRPIERRISHGENSGWVHFGEHAEANGDVMMKIRAKRTSQKNLRQISIADICHLTEQLRSCAKSSFGELQFANVHLQKIHATRERDAIGA